jgi:hypothetical protein
MGIVTSNKTNNLTFYTLDGVKTVSIEGEFSFKDLMILNNIGAVLTHQEIVIFELTE